MKINKINIFPFCTNNWPSIEWDHKFNYAVKPWSASQRSMKVRTHSRCRPQFFRILYDRRRSFVSEFMWRTCIRLNSSYKGLLVRYVTPTPTVIRMCECVLVKSLVCAHRFCIFQADNLSILSTPIPPQILFSSWHGGGTARGKRKGRSVFRSVVSGREIMSLFKNRKFSFARAWKIDIRTLSNALFAASCVRR